MPSTLNNSASACIWHFLNERLTTLAKGWRSQKGVRNILVFRALLAGALDRLLGSPVSPIRSEEDLRDLAVLGSPPVFSLCPSRALTTALKNKGYTHVHSFVAIPSHKIPRWLLPIGDTRGMLAGTHIYQPHLLTPRVIKSLLIRMMKMGWDGGCWSRVLVASREMSPLENLVRAVTGEGKPLFALSLGRQAAVRKLTVQVMRPNGEILGYVKLPLTDAAVERVRNEARILERLWSFPALRPHIPRLLFAGNWNDTYVLFQSALEGERGPVNFNEMHEEFLRTLWNAHCVETPGQALIDELTPKWERRARDLGTEWEELGKEVLRRSILELQGKVLRCGVMHGDFAPWNTRVLNNRLLLFDWESADWEAPTSWDIFHFQVQSSYFFRKNNGFQAASGPEPSSEISFMLHILSSVCQFLEENDQRAISHRKELLIGLLHGRQVQFGGPPFSSLTSAQSHASYH